MRETRSATRSASGAAGSWYSGVCGEPGRRAVSAQTESVASVSKKRVDGRGIDVVSSSGELYAGATAQAI